MESGVDVSERIDEVTDEAVEAVEPDSPPDIGKEVQSFVRGIESLADSLPNVMLAIQTEAREASKRFNEYAREFGTVKDEDEEVTVFSFKPPYDVRAAQLSEQEKRAQVSAELLPQLYVLALVGQFDAFVGRLLRSIFLLRPELIEASERTLTFSQLMELGSIEAAREYMLEKEIETVLRKSHADQFGWMETKFKIELRKGVPTWPVFVELTERRNLFAHTSGVVSEQYLCNCREHGVDLPDDCSRGTELSVDPDYIRQAYACMLEIGVKLAQVLWRKVVPDEIERADDSLNEVAFNLIVAKKYSLAIELLDFGCCVLKRHSSDMKRKILQINRAQAYKWKADTARAEAVLQEEDWSASGLDFQLALSVLRDDFEEASHIMLRIGAKGDVNESAYQEWPLFQEFRQSDEFQSAFEEVFGQPFVHLEKTLQESEKERRRQTLESLRRIIDEGLEGEATPA